EKDTNKSRPRYVIPEREYYAGDTLKLRFYYRGIPSKKYEGRLYVTPGANWYPTTFYGDRAFFEMIFHTPKNLKLAAPGNLVDSRTAGDTLISRWKVEVPARNISFSLGMMNKYEFKSEGLPLIEIYFDDELHKDIARNLSKVINPEGTNLQEHVADDVINAMKLFTDYFGSYSYGTMRVSEIMAMHGEAFPGFVHLGVPGWFRSDDDGYISAARAHEVAHQWWGVSVDYETYHDQWLSEGVAEYCGLMYVQAGFGNEKFLKQLREYRDNIFSIRKYLLGSGSGTGPIAMGYRTLSTETPEDYGPIIYEKAAFCLHMLRNMMIDFKTMKEDGFFSMMTEFYQANQGRSVSTADFKMITDKYFGMDMSWFFEQWIYGNELPTYSMTYQFEKDDRGKYIAICNVKTEGVSEKFKMFVPLEIETEKNVKTYVRILIEGTDFTFTLPGLPKIPRSIRLNPFESVLAKVKQ
ncbi:MAG: M1 family aminopeptidase, partial [Candidatus Zixiibacteriota bacterium]